LVYIPDGVKFPVPELLYNQQLIPEYINIPLFIGELGKATNRTIPHNFLIYDK
jgi:hypothetical protein